MTPSTEPVRRRLSQLLGLEVVGPDGERVGYVNDVRAVLSAGTSGYTSMTLEGLVVSHRTAGSLLGYDRRAEQGPALVRAVVFALHRHATFASFDDVEEIDLDRRQIRLGRDPVPLREA
ncbi:PRC-barrel domain-containing protein [Mumia sp. Pv 4-285]|uniref:PRC-barrel domain-containing protein n=1 Tax=Mumia qirimensis TaxID=3234852 RepID=UPI00351CFC80